MTRRLAMHPSLGCVILLGALLSIAVAGPARGSSQGPRTLFAAGQASSAPQILIADSTVTATGVTPGAEVVWLSVWREGAQGVPTRVTRVREFMADDDEDGAVELSLPRSIPQQSVWIVADVATGQASVRVPEGYRLWRIQPERRRLLAQAVEIDHQDMELVLVRPGVASWHARAQGRRHGPDRGKGQARSRALLETFTPLGKAGRPPQDFKSGDLLLLADARTMRVDVVLIAD